MFNKYIDITKLNLKKLKELSNYLKKNNSIFAFPTETVYGIGSFNSKENESKIFEIKKRPFNKPLAKYYSSINKFIDKNNIKDKNIIKFMNKFLPGPLTIVIKINNILTGIRIPDIEVMRIIIAEMNDEFIGTSANMSGDSAIYNYTKGKTQFPKGLDNILYINELTKKKESTVILIDNNLKILRKGVIPENLIIKEYNKIWK